MPIYDFKCKSCGHMAELMRKVSDANATLCPQCEQATFEKMLSAPNFQLTGSGWYATDFKNSHSKTAPANTEAKSEPATAANCSPGCACH